MHSFYLKNNPVMMNKLPVINKKYIFFGESIRPAVSILVQTHPFPFTLSDVSPALLRIYLYCRT